MRVGLITEGTYPFHIGGVSTWTRTLLHGLPDASVVLIPLHNTPQPLPPSASLPRAVKTIHPLCPPATLAPRAVADWCARVVPTIPSVDLVHTLTAGVAGQLGRTLGQRRDRPLLVTEHAVGWQELASGHAETETGLRPTDRGTAVKALRHLARTVYADADMLTAVSHATHQAQKALGAAPTRCRVIPNGVRVPATPPRPASTPIRFGLVGRITPLKDILTFLRACAHVHAIHPGARFSVVGPATDPAYAAHCRAEARALGLARSLTFVGGVDDVTPWYKDFDGVVLTSRSEAQPLALLEAMSHARPIVATDVGDCARLVHGPTDRLGVAGSICPVGDARAVGEAMLDLAASPARRHSQGRTGWRRVRAHHRHDTMVAAYRQLYAALCPSSHITA